MNRTAKRIRVLLRLLTLRSGQVASLRAEIAALQAAARSAIRFSDRTRRLLIDVSVIARTDAGTGIQRVVREILRQLLDAPPPGYEVSLVRATRWIGYRGASGRLNGKRVRAAPGDIFLGLDYAAHLLPRHLRQLAQWKMAGATVHFVVYDLLPTLHPEWFTDRGVRAQRQWMEALMVLADGLVCISQSVAQELKQWVAQRHPGVQDLISINWFHLGADVGRPAPLPASAHVGLLRRAAEYPAVLMVGTIEPRKGYSLVLSAFERLWNHGRQVNLVIVGRVGWKVEEITRRLRDHPQAGRQLLWLNDADDETLCALYEASSGVLVASEGEGFGLPLIEAARFGKPLLLRDLPVFREIAGANAQYFSTTDADELASVVSQWLDGVQGGTAVRSGDMSWLSWRESTMQLTKHLGL